MNIAFYRAWHEAGRPQANVQFWIAANGNFADLAVLEWCKLFADVRGRHHWLKVVKDTNVFEAGLLQALGMTAIEFAGYVGEMRFLRDKFIAHLDDELVMTLPQLTAAKASAVYLYTYLLENGDEEGAFDHAPHNPVDFFDRYFAEAAAVYEHI